jgi:hypothetical protein
MQPKIKFPNQIKWAQNYTENKDQNIFLKRKKNFFHSNMKGNMPCCREFDSLSDRIVFSIYFKELLSQKNKLSSWKLCKVELSLWKFKL